MNDTSKDAPAVPLDLSAVPFQPYYRDEHCVIYNADCRKVLPFLPKFDLGLHDPPYGIGADTHEGPKEHGWRQWDSCGWDSQKPEPWVFGMILRSSSQTVVWGGNYFELPPSQGWFVWDKGQRDFSLADAELAWTNRDKAIRCFDLPRGKFQATDVRVHPTQKPLALIRWCLTHFPESKTVLDCYAGSLTTAVACKLENKFCVCIEASEAYCEKGVKRLEQGVLF